MREGPWNSTAAHRQGDSTLTGGGEVMKMLQDWQFWALFVGLFGISLQVNLLGERVKDIQRDRDDERKRHRQ